MTNISTATRAELRETLRTMRAENLDVSKQLDLIHSDIIGMDPVTLEHNGGNTDPDQVTTIRAGRLMVRCLAKNAARTAAKLRSACRTPSTRQHVGARVFPKFEQGMSTAEYVAAFETLNQNAYGEVNALPYNLTNYLAPCTLYEGGALDFDAIEEPIDAPERTEPEPTRTPEPMVQIVSGLTGAYLGLLPKSAAHAMAQRHGNTIGTPAPADYTITAARYSKTGTMVIKTHSPDGYSTRASRLAATFGKYSHRQRGYVVTASGAAKFVELYGAGWDCSYLGNKASDRTPPTADQLANAIATHNTKAARQVSELIASATTAAAIEQAGEPTTAAEHLNEATEAASACELATVDAQPDALATTCDASSAGNTGRAPTHGHASSATHQAPQRATHDAHGQRLGQHVSGHSGNWCAVMFRDDCGRPAFEFEGPDGSREVWSFETGRERMAALQTMAREADDEANQDDGATEDQTDDTHTTGEYQQPAPALKTEPGARIEPADEVPRAVADTSAEAFQRTTPQAFDMLAMIAAGIAPADFVGLGIVYSGDRANPSGRGAITAVRTAAVEKYLKVTVTLEDGRSWPQLYALDFKDSIGNRFKTDFKRHGAPYLAELDAARLAAEALRNTAKQAAADDKERQRRELPQQWPQLKAYDPAGKLIGCTLAAHNVRVLLKERFPGVKFSVKTSRFSGGDDLRISWTDGPSATAVEVIADQFSAGSFDGMEDIYNYRRSVFTDIFGDAKYVFCTRHESPELVARALELEYPDASARPTVEDWKQAKGAFDFNTVSHWTREAVQKRLNELGGNWPE